MKRFIRFAARLYPTAWRARYGREFEALLEDLGPGWRDLLNIIRGALAMQIFTLDFWKMTTAMAVAGALVAGFFAFSMPDTYNSVVVFRTATTAAGPTGEQQLVPLMQAVLSQTTVSEIILRDNLYPGVRRNKTLHDAVARMQRDIHDQYCTFGRQARLRIHDTIQVGLQVP